LDSYLTIRLGKVVGEFGIKRKRRYVESPKLHEESELTLGVNNFIMFMYLRGNPKYTIGVPIVE
jgi:hypothetical protein